MRLHWPSRSSRPSRERAILAASGPIGCGPGRDSWLRPATSERRRSSSARQKRFTATWATLGSWLGRCSWWGRSTAALAGARWPGRRCARRSRRSCSWVRSCGQQAREQLARISGARPPGELTPTQHRVAELAAGGLTNRQVADRLSMSPHTVEAHLSAAYQALGIRSRSELRAALATGLLRCGIQPPEPGIRTVIDPSLGEFRLRPLSRCSTQSSPEGPATTEEQEQWLTSTRRSETSRIPPSTSSHGSDGRGSHRDRRPSSARSHGSVRSGTDPDQPALVQAGRQWELEHKQQSGYVDPVSSTAATGRSSADSRAPSDQIRHVGPAAGRSHGRVFALSSDDAFLPMPRRGVGAPSTQRSQSVRNPESASSNDPMLGSHNIEDQMHATLRTHGLAEPEQGIRGTFYPNEGPVAAAEAIAAVLPSHRRGGHGGRRTVVRGAKRHGGSSGWGRRREAIAELIASFTRRTDGPSPRRRAARNDRLISRSFQPAAAAARTSRTAFCRATTPWSAVPGEYPGGGNAFQLRQRLECLSRIETERGRLHAGCAGENVAGGNGVARTHTPSTSGMKTATLPGVWPGTWMIRGLPGRSSVAPSANVSTAVG